LHHIQSHGSPPPVIDPQQYRLLIHGLVHRPLIFTLDELKRLPSVSRVHFVMCAGNQGRTLETRMGASHGATSCSEWTGVLLSVLLKEAGVKPEAKWLVAEGGEAKKHTISIPLEKAMDDTLVAYGQNGEPLRPEQGYPLRLLLPGWGGGICTKWLRRIKVVDQPYRQEGGDRGLLRSGSKTRWSQFEIPPKSVITRPSGGQRLPGPGFYEITGLAWSGGGAIRRVEVSTDGGRSWKDAQLQEPVLPLAHTRFRSPWTWNGEETLLQSRCTDERGDIQPSLAEMGRIWGGKPEDLLLNSRVTCWNAIQPWKVTHDGSLHNAMFS
ncbi:MAG: molybdopterin-dependent oxidoreductase, partial [Acidobacteria bacterium]|nr:molybdopterin-dependent oxidoreductase [Acidobacteriota bacterium]